MYVFEPTKMPDLQSEVGHSDERVITLSRQSALSLSDPVCTDLLSTLE